jgi:hypothetical protein
MPFDLPGGSEGGKKKLNKKTIGIAVAGIGAGVVIYIIIKRRNAASAATPQTGTTDPGIDPNTGIPYADELGGTAGYGGGYGGFGGYPQQSVNTTGTVNTVTTNAQWAQAVEAYMEALGYNVKDVGLAIGKYLSNQPLTAEQKQLIEQAIGFEGQPPSGSFPIHSYPPKGHKGDKGKGDVKVPNVLHHTYPSAVAKMTAKGLKTARSKTGIQHGGRVLQEHPDAGTDVKRGSTVTLEMD